MTVATTGSSSRTRQRPALLASTPLVWPPTMCQEPGIRPGPLATKRGSPRPPDHQHHAISSPIEQQAGSRFLQVAETPVCRLRPTGSPASGAGVAESAAVRDQ